MMVHDRHTRYYHKSTYHFLKSDGTVRQVDIDVQFPKEALLDELKSLKSFFEAEKVVLHWTARRGFVNEEINV